MGAALTFGAQLLTAGELGAEQYGVYATLFAWLQITMAISSLGTAEASLKFLPPVIAHHDVGAYYGYRRFSFLLTLGVGATISCSGALLFAIFTSQDLRLLALFAVGVPLLGLIVLQRQALRAHDAVVWSNVIEQILQPIMFMACFGAAAMLGADVDAVFAAASFVSSSLLAALLQGRSLRRLAPTLASKQRTYRSRSWLAGSTPFIAVTAFGALLTRADIAIAAMVLPAQEVGLYAIASRLGASISLIGSAFHLTLVPALSASLAADQLARSRSIMACGYWLVLGTTISAGVAITALSAPLLSVIGEEFTDVTPLVALICGANVVATLAGPSGWAALLRLTSTANIALVAVAAGVAVLGGVVLGASYGAMGIAGSFGTALVVRHGGSLFVLRQREPGLMARRST